jgi:hypothetical protein
MKKAAKLKGQNRVSYPASNVDKSSITFSLTRNIDHHNHHSQYVCGGWSNPFPTSPIESKKDYIMMECPKRKKRVPWGSTVRE